MKTPIECFVCGRRCGWSYSATWNDSIGGSPAEDSGDGENYMDRKGNWHCGEKCLRVTEEQEAEYVMQDLDLFERGDCQKCGDTLCKHGHCVDTCSEDCDTCAENAHERWLENYHGADTPQTETERFQVERMKRRVD